MPGSGQRCFRNAGQVYTGDVLEDEEGFCTRHGLGRLIVQATTVRGETVVWGRYTGAFKQDKMTGSGTYRWSDGSVYEGAFLDGRPHGHGKFAWPEGSTYDGLWEHGEMNGQGSFHDAFAEVDRHGVFHRNCLQLHDGSWVDVRREREERRTARLRIGALGPGAEARMPVLRCRPEDAAARAAAALREPPHLVPLLLADASCPAGQEDAEDVGPYATAAPLWCLQAGDLGCTSATTVHLAFVAAEQRRRRDVQQIFRSAIREALLTYRPFVLAFGEESEGGNPQDDEAPAPACWSLREFFDSASLPLDLFDLRHFQGSGGPERFLPPEKRGWRCPPAETPPAAAGGDPAMAEQSGAAQEPLRPPALAPATVYLLHFALASLRRLDRGLSDEEVRAHVGRRFSDHLPLHRVAALVVSAEA